MRIADIISFYAAESTEKNTSSNRPVRCLASGTALRKIEMLLFTTENSKKRWRKNELTKMSKSASSQTRLAAATAVHSCKNN